MFGVMLLALWLRCTCDLGSNSDSDCVYGGFLATASEAGSREADEGAVGTQDVTGTCALHVLLVVRQPFGVQLHDADPLQNQRWDTLVRAAELGEASVADLMLATQDVCISLSAAAVAHMCRSPFRCK